MSSHSVALTNTRPVALVTGARRGLGRAIAYSLAEAGYDLVVNDIIDDADTAKTLDGLAVRGGAVRFLQHDISDVSGHANFVSESAAAFGRLDCLVNNAGVQVPRRIGLLEVEENEFDFVVNVNLRGTFFLTQEVARRMAKDSQNGLSGPKSIISITSANSALASTDKAAYCLAKMTALFALELGQFNISVFEIRPGLMVTDMTAAVREKYAAYVDQNTVFRRWGEPEEIGRAVSALATGAIPYASGEIINVDCGMHIGRL
jgi:3-oxoacyl-[acyl-carrier protein] reductase